MHGLEYQLKYKLSVQRCFVYLILLCGSSAAFANTTSGDKQYQYHLSAVPDWVASVDEAQSKDDQRSDGEQYLLVDNQVKLTKTEQQYFSHYKVRFDQHSAIASGSDIRVRFDPAYEVPYIHVIDVIRDGKRINQLNKDKLKFITSEDSQQSNIYGGKVEALLLLEDIRLGDIVEYSYTIKGANPVFDNHFSRFFSLGWSVSVDNVFVRVVAPKSIPLLYKTQGIEQTVAVKPLGENVEYSMQLAFTEEFIDEGNTPDWFDTSPWLQFSQYRDWQHVSDWAYQLFQLEQPLSDEVESFITSLKSLKKAEAISKATRFIQDDIRYLGLELAENSHKPHHPNETFNNRYGDCKDKSLLLTTILTKLGIDAYPALVSTTDRGHLDKYLASHNLFDHAIVTIDIDGKSIWIDPTVSYQGTSLDSIHQPEYGQALVIKKHTSGLTVAKPTEKVAATLEIEESYFAADYFSPVIWTIKNTYRGGEAEDKRYRMSTQTNKKMLRNYMNYYAKTYPKIRLLEAPKIKDDRDNNILVIIEKYLVPGFWQKGDNEAGFELYAKEVSHYLRPPKTIRRQQPIAVNTIDSMVHKVTLSMPEDIDFSADVGKKVVEDRYFRLSRSFDYDHRRVSLTTHYQRKQHSVKAPDVVDHLAKLKKARKLLSYDGSITNVDNDSDIEQMKTLIQAFNDAVQVKQL